MISVNRSRIIDPQKQSRYGIVFQCVVANLTNVFNAGGWTAKIER